MAEGRKKTGRVKAVLKYPPHWFTPADLLTFVEMKPFSRRWDDLGLTDEDMNRLQTLIMANPTADPVIEGTGGLRKKRCGRITPAQSKRDGYRVCYVYFEEFGTVLFVLIYPKNEQDDIPESHKPSIKTTIERIRSRLASRPYRFGPRADHKGEQ